MFAPLADIRSIGLKTTLPKKASLFAQNAMTTWN